LKGELKITDQTAALGKNGLQMFHRVAERIGLGTGWGLLSAIQLRADFRQPAAQPQQQVINRFQRKRQAQFLGGGSDVGVGQQVNQEFAQQDGADRMARENVGQKDRKRASASPTQSAIGAKDPLASG
jgi:hypothetical protein